jgi:hypothetical protein
MMQAIGVPLTCKIVDLWVGINSSELGILSKGIYNFNY